MKLLKFWSNYIFLVAYSLLKMSKIKRLNKHKISLLIREPEQFFARTRKLPYFFAALFVFYSSRSRLRDSLCSPCYEFLLFFTTYTQPIHRETDSGEGKFITPRNKIHNPILGYDCCSLLWESWQKHLLIGRKIKAITST